MVKRRAISPQMVAMPVQPIWPMPNPWVLLTSQSSKRVGLTVEAMTGDRGCTTNYDASGAGIEAMISYLKRCFGLSRCNWKGLDHFKAYVHSAVFTHNLNWC